VSSRYHELGRQIYVLTLCLYKSLNSFLQYSLDLSEEATSRVDIIIYSRLRLYKFLNSFLQFSHDFRRHDLI
jgi:hypothetical protein